MGFTYARKRQRRRAVLTAVDFTRGQSAPQIADRLSLAYCSAYRFLAALERDGLVTATATRPVLWTRR